MVIQAAGIWMVLLGGGLPWWLLGSGMLGLGTACVYPTLLAAVSDVVPPVWRARALGVYRFWRDMGYALGAFLSGIIADLFGVPAAMHLVAALTLWSGLVVARTMYETLAGRRRPPSGEPVVAAQSR
jgi:MFS family permease